MNLFKKKEEEKEVKEVSNSSKYFVLHNDIKVPLSTLISLCEENKENDNYELKEDSEIMIDNKKVKINSLLSLYKA